MRLFTFGLPVNINVNVVLRLCADYGKFKYMCCFGYAIDANALL